MPQKIFYYRHDRGMHKYFVLPSMRSTRSLCVSICESTNCEYPRLSDISIMNDRLNRSSSEYINLIDNLSLNYKFNKNVFIFPLRVKILRCKVRIWKMDSWIYAHSAISALRRLVRFLERISWAKWCHGFLNSRAYGDPEIDRRKRYVICAGKRKPI